MADFLSAAQGVNYLAPYAVRGGGTGGVARGALGMAGTGATLGSVVPGIGTGIGALAGLVGGGIMGAFGKHAKSAATDISNADARAAVARAYADAYHGTKQATPQFLDQALGGGSSQWSGAKEVQNAIANIQANAAREQAGSP